MIPIAVIAPITTKDFVSASDFESFGVAGIAVSVSCLDFGPPSIESAYDDALAVPDLLRRCVEAERDGAKAVVIDCMGDPGVRAARELVSIPVLGPSETSMHVAALLGRRFSFVTVLPSVIPMLHDMVHAYGMRDRFASVRCTHQRVLEIRSDPQFTYRRLIEESIAAATQDAADVVILGCTGFMGAADEIRREFLLRNISVSVIDPVSVTLHTAATLARLNLAHNKTQYPFPAIKAVVGFERLTSVVSASRRSD